MGLLSAVPIIGNIIDKAENIISELVEDKDKRNELASRLRQIQLEAENKLLDNEHEEKMAQIELNKENAKSQSWFIAGWRPFCGWICATGLAYQWIIKQIIIFGLAVASIWFPTASAIIALLPTLDIAEIIGLLIPLLGLGVYRTVEKIKGVINK